jgi:short-subunit dehydrogenase
VAREELAPDGIVVSLVYPWVTATEFHQSLRAGQVRPEGHMPPHSAEHVARGIVRAIRCGEAEVVLTPGPERPEDVEASAGGA